MSIRCPGICMGRQMSFYYLANFSFFLSLFISLFEITNFGTLGEVRAFSSSFDFRAFGLQKIVRIDGRYRRQGRPSSLR